jgi:hypothetical protein
MLLPAMPKLNRERNAMLLDTEEATRFVIRGLSRFGKRHDLTREVCERYNLSWDDANAFIAAVEAENSQTINARRGGVLNVFAIIFIIVGSFLMLSMVLSPFIGLSFSRMMIPYWGNVSIFITGLGLTLGGLVQLLKLVQD